MTCLVAALASDGMAFLAADTCISWRWGGPQGTTYVYEDELQKLYAVDEHVTLGVCGDLLAAKPLVAQCEAMFRSGSVMRSFARGRYHPFVVLSFLARLLAYLCRTRRRPGSVWLSIGIANPAATADVFTWSSQHPLRLQRLLPGEVKLLGSIHDDADLATDLEARLSGALAATAQPTETRIALFQHEFVQALQGDRGRTALVGGLPQFATCDGTRFWLNGYDSESYRAGPEPLVHAVSMEWDPSDARWFQVDRASGRRLALCRIDEHNFRRSPTQGNMFTY